jgi:hypothetical protein
MTCCSSILSGMFMFPDRLPNSPKTSRGSFNRVLSVGVDTGFHRVRWLWFAGACVKPRLVLVSIARPIVWSCICGKGISAPKYQPVNNAS